MGDEEFLELHERTIKTLIEIENNISRQIEFYKDKIPDDAGTARRQDKEMYDYLKNSFDNFDRLMKRLY